MISRAVSSVILSAFRTPISRHPLSPQTWATVPSTACVQPLRSAAIPAKPLQISLDLRRRLCRHFLACFARFRIELFPYGFDAHFLTLNATLLHRP
jgi:hypothetical protein